MATLWEKRHVVIDSCKSYDARQIRVCALWRTDTKCTNCDALFVQNDIGDHSGETVATKRISEYRRHYGIAVRHVYFIGRIRQRCYYLFQIMQREIYVTSFGQRSLSDFRLPNTFGPVVTENDNFSFLDTRSRFLISRGIRITVMVTSYSHNKFVNIKWSKNYNNVFL